MFDRLIRNWVYGAALGAVLLLIITPLMVGHQALLVIAAFLHLPAYMIHQYEEHDADRFRTFFNETVGKGREMLSPLAVFVINIFGVWGTVTISVYLAATVNHGWSLIAVYLVLVNALVHIAHAIGYRRYNPGLITALFVFLPLGFVTMSLVQQGGQGSLGYHVTGLVVAVFIHLAILVHVKLKLQRMETLA